MDHEKKPLRHVSINMLPLTVGTLERTRSLLGKLSKPADTDSGAPFLFFGKIELL